LLNLIERFRAKGREDLAVTRRKQEVLVAKMHAGETVDFKQVRQIVKALGLKRYAVIGGQASIFYGVPRSTVDVDVIAGSDAIALAVKDFHPVPSPLNVGGSTVNLFGIDVDLLHYNDPAWLDQLLEEAAVFDGVRVVSKPWLIVLKLNAARYVDLIDVVPVANSMNDVEVEHARELVGKYAPAEAEDFESILQFGDLALPPETEQE
jgi:hypothetical protein